MNTEKRNPPDIEKERDEKIGNQTGEQKNRSRKTGVQRIPLVLYIMIGWLGVLSTVLILDRIGVWNEGSPLSTQSHTQEQNDLAQLMERFQIGGGVEIPPEMMIQLQQGDASVIAERISQFRDSGASLPTSGFQVPSGASADQAARGTTGMQARNPTAALGDVFSFINPQVQRTTDPIYLTYTVLNEPEDETIRLLGTLEAETLRVHAKVSSDILSLSVQEGDFITKDATVAVLNDLSFRISYLSKLTEYELSSERSPRDRELIKMQLDKAEEDLRNVVVFSPADGIVSSVMRAEGERISEGTQMIALVDLGNMSISAAVDEMDFNRVYKGMPVIVTFQNYNTHIAGSVRSISPIARTISGVVVVPITVSLQENPWDHGIIAGVTCDVDLIVQSFAQGYTIPIQALGQDEQGYFVMKKEMEMERKVYVQVGGHSERLVEIVDGVKPGDVLIIRQSDSMTTGRVP
jgi:multidrug efflux pump subunit AcrA (membrane-fusion protein)